MAKKGLDMKEIGLTVLLGSGVVIATPLLASLVADVGLMAIQIVPGHLSVGTALAAGVSAFVIDLGISKWLR